MTHSEVIDKITSRFVLFQSPPHIPPNAVIPTIPDSSDTIVMQPPSACTQG